MLFIHFGLTSKHTSVTLFFWVCHMEDSLKIVISCKLAKASASLLIHEDGSDSEGTKVLTGAAEHSAWRSAVLCPSV